MPSGFQMGDGRDFDSVFTFGDGGQTTGFQVTDGTDLGRRYIAGNSGFVTGFQNVAGVDLGSVLGTYVPMALTIDRIETLNEASAIEVTVFFTVSGGVGPYVATLTVTDMDGGNAVTDIQTLQSNGAKTGFVSFGGPGEGARCSLTVRDATGASVTQSRVLF